MYKVCISIRKYFVTVNNNSNPETNVTNNEELLTADNSSIVNNLTSKEDLLAKQLSEVKMICIILTIAFGVCFVCSLVTFIFFCFRLKNFKRKFVLVPERKSLKKIGLCLLFFLMLLYSFKFVLIKSLRNF